MLTKLMDSPIARTFLAIIAILGFAYAIFCQQKNKERKEFSYYLKSNTLIERKKSKFEKLSIAYNEQEIESLCVSRFTIWNSGNRTLNHTDMVKSRELTISASDDSKILDAELIACPEETNKFSIEMINEQTAKIQFDYADKKDGVVVQIIHTGTADSLKIDCKIKGGVKIKNAVNETAPKFIVKVFNTETFEKSSLVTMGITIALMMAMSILCAIAVFDQDLQNTLLSPTISSPISLQVRQIELIILSIMFGLGSLITGIMYVPLIKKYFGIGIPKKLKEHTG